MTLEEFWNTGLRTEEPVLEIKIHGIWHKVSPYIFRSWSGARRIDDKEVEGPVYFLGSNEVSRP